MGELLKSFPDRFGPNNPYPIAVPNLNPTQLDALADTYLTRLHSHSATAARITDKMPHNFLHVGLIARLFPKARVVFCERDAEDTCLSIFSHNFSASHMYATDLAELGRYYRASAMLMDQWKRTGDIAMMTVRYEDLVANPDKLSKDLVGFCGLEWDDECLHFHESGGMVATPSHAQVREPVHSRAVGRWKNYEPYLRPLLDALGRP